MMKGVAGSEGVLHMKKRRIIALLVLLLGVGVAFFSGSRLLEAKQIFDEGNTTYQTLSDQVVIASEAASDAYRGTQLFEQKPELEQRIDFKALKAVNKDAVAWLYSPGTIIDYPVVRADDYDYYLYHLIDHTYNVNGTLFIDYNNAPDFSERLTVIYGHHMASGMMFTELVRYQDQEYYQEHPCMYLYTEEGAFQVDLMYGFVIGAGQWRSQGFMYQENLEELLACAAQNTGFVSDIRYEEGDRVVAMSTCSYEFDDARYVVIGVVKQPQGSIN